MNGALLVVTLAALSIWHVCASELGSYPATKGLPNFHRVNYRLYRGGQPSELGITNLQRLGIKTIVNLRMTNEQWAAEEAVAHATGLIYTNVPMSNLDRPTDEQVSQVLSIIDTFPAPVFIHCRYGCDRTGTIIACYRIQHDKRSGIFALREAEHYGMSEWELEMKDYILNFGKSRKRK